MVSQCLSRRRTPFGKSFSSGLHPLGDGGIERTQKVRRDGIQKANRREAPWKATVDLDAVIVEAQEKEAYFTYLGGRDINR